MYPSQNITVPRPNPLSHWFALSFDCPSMMYSFFNPSEWVSDQILLKKWVLPFVLLPLSPRTATNMLFKRLKRIRVLMYEMKLY